MLGRSRRGSGLILMVVWLVLLKVLLGRRRLGRRWAWLLDIVGSRIKDERLDDDGAWSNLLHP